MGFVFWDDCFDAVGDYFLNAGEVIGDFCIIEVPVMGNT